MRGIAVLAAGLGLAACASTGPGPFTAADAPPDQAAFVAAVQAHQRPQGERQSIEGIEKKIAARDKAACAAKPQSRMNGWIGQVALKSQESDGRYHIIVDIGPGVSVTATGPLQHDPHAGGPATPARRRVEEQLVDAMRPLERGRAVVFSGMMTHGFSDRCPRPSNLLIAHRLDSPSYMVTFDTIVPR